MDHPRPPLTHLGALRGYRTCMADFSPTLDASPPHAHIGRYNYAERSEVVRCASLSKSAKLTSLCALAFALAMYLLSLLALTSFALLGAYHLLSHLYGLFFSPHRNIPGPFSARFGRLYYFAHVYGGRWEHLNIKLHRQYKAPIVRVAPNCYSVSDPAALKTIYGPGSKFTKSAWYEGWKHPDPSQYSLFTYRNNELHAKDRKKYSAMYSMSALVSYEKYVDECASIFGERLNELARNGARLDMSHWFNCYAFDVIGDITYSKRFGFLDKGEDISGIMKALEVQMPYATLVGIYPEMHPILFRIMSRFPGSGAAGRSYLMNFGRKMLKERQELESVRVRGDITKDIESAADEDMDLPTDLLQKFLNDLYGGKEGWKMDDVFKMCLSNIVAGADTTAVSLSSILMHLLKYPQTLQRLRAELQEFEAKGECGNPNVSFKEAQNMPYLQAVIKEALRVHPATGLPLWRVVPPEGAEICGHHFKAGDVVGANSWVLHYNEEVWGPDVAIFRPERWLDEPEEKLKAMERAYMPFGLGARTCIGKNVSMLEMSKLIPQLVRRFDFEIENRDKPWKTTNFWFVKQGNFNVRVRVRSEKA